MRNRGRALCHPGRDSEGGLAEGQVGLHGRGEVPFDKGDNLVLEVVGVGETREGGSTGDREADRRGGVELGGGSGAEAQEEHRDNCKHCTHEGGLHPGAGDSDRKDGRECDQALKDALGDDVVVEGKNDHAQKPAQSVRTGRNESVVNIRGREDVVVASLLLNGVKVSVGEEELDHSENLGHDCSEPEEAEEEVSNTEGRKSGDNVPASDTKVRGKASPEEKAREASNGEGGGVRTRRQECTGEETVSVGSVDKGRKEIIEPGN